MSDRFHIMAKPVCGVCNLSCRYCYYKDKPRELYPQETLFHMSGEVLESFVRQYMEAQPQRCEFGWQGGEPLLAGREFYERAVELQERFGRAGQTVANAIQTNGTLLDEEWCELLTRRRFLVGVSLDGAPQWHDAFRRDQAGNASHHRAWAGVELLRKHNVEFNVLVTLHGANAGHGSDLYRYFVNRGVRYLQFIPILERRADGTPEDFSCSPRQYGRFLLEVFEQWAARDVGRVSERFIDGILHKMLFAAAALCCQAERCASAFVLEYNGDLYACDHFVTERWRLGNILRRPLVDLVADPLLEEFSRLKTRLPAACRDCEFLDYCNGGCPKHHVPLYGGADRANYFCEAYKMFFRAALPELRRLAEEYRRGAAVGGATALPEGEARANGEESLATGRSLPAAAGEAEGRADGEPDVQGPPLRGGPWHRATRGASLPPSPEGRPRVGRNDPCPCGSGRKFKSCCGRGR